MTLSSISSSVGSLTQYPILVNGYLCYSAAQVAEARNFVNPHPAAKLQSSSQATNSSAPYNSSRSVAAYNPYTASGKSKSSASSSLGALFDILA